MKQFMCCDAGFDCKIIVRASSDEEILQIAGLHAKEVHGVTITPDMTKQIRSLITDVSDTYDTLSI